MKMKWFACFFEAKRTERTNVTMDRNDKPIDPINELIFCMFDQGIVVSDGIASIANMFPHLVKLLNEADFLNKVEECSLFFRRLGRVCEYVKAQCLPKEEFANVTEKVTEAFGAKDTNDSEGFL